MTQLHRNKSPSDAAFWPGKSPILFGNSEDVTYLRFGLVTSYYSSDPRCFATNFSGLKDSQLRPEVRTKMVLVAAKAADVDVKLQAWPRIERVCCLVLHLAAHI